MDLLQNPFHILNATPRDNRARIIELSQERSLLPDSGDCMQACSDLTNPRKRLAMEVAWLPGLGPKSASDTLAMLENSQSDLLHMDRLTSAARANLLAAGLTRLTDSPPDEVATWILELARALEDIDPENLCAIINEERTVSGFAEVTDLNMVEAEIQERRRYYRQVIKSALDSLPSRELVGAVTAAVESATNNGEEHGPILIHDVVDSYEVEAQAFFEKEESNIRTLVDDIRSASDAGQPDSVLAPMIDKLIYVVKNWGSVARPMQISTKSRGLDHAASYQVAGLVRELAVHLFNQHDKIDFSRQLTGFLMTAFAAKVAGVAERSLEDANTLAEIAQQRARTEEWRKEITYEAKMGLLYKKTLRISPEGIEWRGRRWDLDSITRVRWGGTRHSINGIPTGTIYTIVWGDQSGCSSIQLRKEAIYTNFVDRIWKAVGVRLLTEFLHGLRDGKQYQFGPNVVSDQGMTLERKKFLRRNEWVFCHWNDLVIWNGPGVFCVAKNNERKVAAAFSYQDQDNIHILESAMRLFWKRGGDRLSIVLEEE